MSIPQVQKIKSLFAVGVGHQPIDIAHENIRDEIQTTDLKLELADGQQFTLDSRNKLFPVWTDFLEFQHRADLHVYVESDSDSKVTTLYPVCPRTVDEIDLFPVEGRLRVTFVGSPAIFTLNPGDDKFSGLKETLLKAAIDNERLLITHHPLTFEILNVTDNPDAVVAPPTERPNPSKGALTLAECFEIFEFLKNTDIPFDHPRDCCTARAQKMCRLMAERDIASRKIWNYGHGFNDRNSATLFIKTPIDPSGRIFWRFHVAPVVNLLDESENVAVLDPALDGLPLPVDDWLEKQNDPDSTFEFSDVSVFSNKPHSLDDLFDPGPKEIDDLLNCHIGSHKLAKGLQRTL